MNVNFIYRVGFYSTKTRYAFITKISRLELFVECTVPILYESNAQDVMLHLMGHGRVTPEL
jgi:hypothetical protein